MMKLKRTMFALVLCVTAPFYQSIARAQVSNQALPQTLPSRVVTTSGTGTVQVAPDQVYVTVGVKVWDKDLHKAYELNEEKSRNLLALAPQFRISTKNVQTNGVSVEPTYPPNHRNAGYETADAETPTGYEVEQSVIFVLDDLKKLRNLITSAVDAGANQIRSIEFDTSNLRQFKDEARILALRAAKEKATAMAHEYGVKLGKVVTIQEVGSTVQGLSSNSRYTYFPNMTNNIGRAITPASVEVSDSIAPGQLKIISSVSTTFELTE